jgi:hypothetical protein
MTSPSTTLTSVRPGAFGKSVAKDPLFRGGVLVLLLFVLYVPLQIKIDARVGKVTGMDLPEGLAFVNFLFAAALAKWFSLSSRSEGEDSLTRALTACFAGVGLFSVLSFFTGQVFTGGGKFLYDLIVWKRTASMLLVFFFTKKLIRTERQVTLLLTAMAVVVGFAGFNLLNENLSNGLAASHFKDGLRFGGIFDWGGENDLGAFLAEFVFIPLALIKLENGIVKKLFFAVLVLLAITGCIFTYSRGAWIGLSVGMAIYIWRHSRMSLAFILLISIFFGTYVLPTSVVERWNMTENTETGQLESSAQSRVDVWQQGLDLVIHYPVFGVGYERFVSMVPMKLEPHNAYLKVAAEQGVPALLVFLCLLGVALANSCGATEPFERELSIAFSASWAAFMVVNLFGNRFFREGLICYFWVFTGVIVWLRTQRIKRLATAK